MVMPNVIESISTVISFMSRGIVICRSCASNGIARNIRLITIFQFLLHLLWR